MRVKSILAAAVLVAASVPSFAVGGATPLTFTNGVAGFSNVVFGNFSDIWEFTIGANDGTAVSATNVSLGFGFINSFAGTLAGKPLTLSVTPGAATVQVLSGSTAALTPGVYTLTITGDTGGGAASYGGSLIAIAAVPEPETYALMLAGLGVIGFLAARRKSV